jgi:hypothetical protein
LSTDAGVDALITRYTPEIAAATRECRRRLRAFVPRGYELVYDNYNALAIGYAPTDRASDAVVSIAAYPRWVTLFFLHGRTLVDPQALLKGSGSRVRSIRLKEPADLEAPAVVALLEQALATRGADFAAAPALATIVKSVSARQRPRRPA